MHFSEIALKRLTFEMFFMMIFKTLFTDILFHQDNSTFFSLQFIKLVFK